MKPKISIATLGVRNLQVSTDFYTKLGFTVSEHSNEHITFFALEGTWLGLFPATELAKDAQVPAEGSGFRQFSLAHNVASPAEVDETLAHAQECGATIVKPGQKVFWGGYSGYFTDPDGFLWEVAHNPFLDLT